MRKGRRFLLGSLVVSGLLGGMTPVAMAGDVWEQGTDVYRVFIEADQASGKFGTYALGTGTAMEKPAQRNKNILRGAFFPPQEPKTTYLTIRSWSSETDYVSRSGTPSSGFTVLNLNDFPHTIEELDRGFKTTWSVSGSDSFTVIQEIDVEGNDLQDSRIRMTTRVQNDGGEPLVLGIRYEWDIMVGNVDASIFRKIYPPPSAWQDGFEAFPLPDFPVFEVTDVEPPGNLFSIFGTVAGVFHLTPPPTPPDLLYYCSWPEAYNHAWTFDVTGGQEDSAVVYFWGDPEEKASVVPPGGETSVTAYLATVTFPPPPESVPALGPWGIFLMAGVLGLLILWKRR